MTSDLLAIGEVASAAGIAVSAVRYYDEVGLVPAQTRVGGKRRFDPSAIGRVNFVQRCQQAGFSLEEIGAVLDDTEGGWRAIVDAKLAELIERQDHLSEMIELLREVRACGCEVVATCGRRDTSC